MALLFEIYFPCFQNTLTGSRDIQKGLLESRAMLGMEQGSAQITDGPCKGDLSPPINEKCSQLDCAREICFCADISGAYNAPSQKYVRYAPLSTTSRRVHLS